MPNSLYGEIEVQRKYRLPNDHQLADRLVDQLGGKVRFADNIETDAFFESASRQDDEHLVLVRARHPSRDNLLVVKSKTSYARHVLEIGDTRHAKRILELLGLRHVLTIEKKRTMVLFDQMNVKLDTVGSGAQFLECGIWVDSPLEIEECERRIDEFARTLGIAGFDVECRSYLDIHLDWLRSNDD